MRPALLVAALLLPPTLVALSPLSRSLAQEKDKKPPEKSEEERLADDMAGSAKKFLAAMKVSAKDAVAKASLVQPGTVVGVHPDEQPRKVPKGAKEETDPCYEVFLVTDKGAAVAVTVDAEGKSAAPRPLKDEAEKEAKDTLKRLAAVTPMVSVASAIDKVSGFSKGTVLAVLLEEKPDTKTKSEAWLVYVLVGERTAYYRIDVVSGEIARRS